MLCTHMKFIYTVESVGVSDCGECSVSMFLMVLISLQLSHQVSFSSRIPVAFPTGDANSLSKNILMYACTLTEGETAGTGDQGRMVQRVSHSASASAGLGSPTLVPSPNPRPGISPAVMMVSKHVDGSLNQVKDQTSEHGIVCLCV